MLRKIDVLLSALSPLRLGLFAFFLVALIGSLDHLTGYELSFSIFYLLPVGLASWYLKGHIGIIVCIASATVWLVVDYTSGNLYGHLAIPFWNAIVRLGFFVIVALLLERLRSTLELQKSLAQLDSLTGLMNARAFKQSCHSVIELAARNGRPLAVGYIDLDAFKVINDTLGHSVGDQVLREVANTLTKQLRNSDISGRLGGDEFCVLLPDTDLAGARVLFSKLQTSLLNFAAINHWPLGFSVGVAVLNPPQENIDEALKRADALMYRVKNSGKNRILFEEYAA